MFFLCIFNFETSDRSTKLKYSPNLYGYFNIKKVNVRLANKYKKNTIIIIDILHYDCELHNDTL